MASSNHSISPEQLAYLASLGRGGDSMLAHINPEEAEILKLLGGSGTINPRTGLPEFAIYEDTSWGNMEIDDGGYDPGDWGGGGGWYDPGDTGGGGSITPDPTPYVPDPTPEPYVPEPTPEPEPVVIEPTPVVPEPEPEPVDNSYWERLAAEQQAEWERQAAAQQAEWERQAAERDAAARAANEALWAQQARDAQAAADAAAAAQAARDLQAL